ncbi:OmpA family protein [Cupriavidus pauculus]|jgi:outer membrane protein OmpA-like peptidoglycan-associated protein|uniref:OmpA family protein n=1 Tax=Cupriavidus pauculus TaxID=82633 RepID=A0A5P2H159_9BURK|nr:OmpA family protein [Cupriavidus pauculus]QET01140.1 OmpA family protein [Cupriavidus pauculus]
MPLPLARLARLAVTLLVCTVAIAGCQTVPPAPPPEPPPPKLSPTQVTVLKEKGFALTDQGWELGMPHKVLFGFDEHTISGPRRYSVLDVGRALSRAGIEHVRVDGHTDDVGTDEYNRILSLRRALAVVRLLVEAGFARDHIEVRGLGKSRPVADNKTAAGRAENRRVAIIVTVD